MRNGPQNRSESARRGSLGGESVGALIFGEGALGLASRLQALREHEHGARAACRGDVGTPREMLDYLLFAFVQLSPTQHAQLPIGADLARIGGDALQAIGLGFRPSSLIGQE